MKFFELELTAEETASQLKLNYRSVQVLFHEFRILLTSFDLKKIIPDQTLLKDEELIYLIENNDKVFLTNNNDLDSRTIAITIKRHFIQEGPAYFHFELSNINKM